MLSPKTVIAESKAQRPLFCPPYSCSARLYRLVYFLSR